MVNPSDLKEGQQVILCSVDEALERNEGPGIIDEMEKFFDGAVVTIERAARTSREFRIEEDKEWIFHIDWIDKIISDKYKDFDKEEIDKFIRLGIEL